MGRLLRALIQPWILCTTVAVSTIQWKHLNGYKSKRRDLHGKKWNILFSAMVGEKIVMGNFGFSKTHGVLIGVKMVLSSIKLKIIINLSFISFRLRRGTDESHIESMGERAFIKKEVRKSVPKNSFASTHSN